MTFLALGNGAPDIFASIAGIRQSRPELVMGELFGGGIFVTTVVAGAILLTGSFKVMERPICRDIFFYAASCFVVWSIAYVGTIFLWEAITILVVYALYIGVVVVGRIIYAKQRIVQNTIPSVVITACSDTQPVCQSAEQMYDRRESVHSVSKILKIARSRNSSASSFNSADPLPVHDDVITRPRKTNRGHEFAMQLLPFKWKELRHESIFTIAMTIVKSPIQLVLLLTIPVIDPEDASESWSQILNCLHLITGPLILATAAGAGSVSIRGFPCLVIVAMIGVCLALAVFFTSKPDSPPVYYPAFSLLAFVISCCWIYTLASEVVALLETLGFMLNVSEAILGLTVLAWGNSIGDLIANIAIARHGYQRMAISACFGGPLLSKPFAFALRKIRIFLTSCFHVHTDLLLGIGIPYSIVLPEAENMSIKVAFENDFDCDIHDKYFIDHLFCSDHIHQHVHFAPCGHNGSSLSDCGSLHVDGFPICEIPWRNFDHHLPHLPDLCLPFGI